MVEHKMALRQVPILQHSQQVYIIEGQMGPFSVSPYWHALRDPGSALSSAPSTIFMTSEASIKNAGGVVVPAIPLGNEDKERFVMIANDFFKGRRMCLSDPVAQGFVTHRDGRPQPESVISDLRTQLLAFKYQVREPDDRVHQKTVAKFSGKAGGMNDDLTMAMLLGIYHSTVFYYRTEWTRMVPGLPKSSLIAGFHHTRSAVANAVSMHADEAKSKTWMARPPTLGEILEKAVARKNT